MHDPSPSIRAAIASGKPELVLLPVPPAFLTRSARDVDTRDVTARCGP
jgi:hypothetical protein